MADATPQAPRPAFQEAATSPAHPKVPYGKCNVCGHCGDDCTGRELTRYRLSFEIRDGDNEYYKDTIMDCDHEPTEEEQVKYVHSQYAVYDSEKELAAAWLEEWEEYQGTGCLYLGGDYRIIQDVGIEPEPSEMTQLKAVHSELLEAAKENIDFLPMNARSKKLYDAIGKAEGRA
jgi:hypothetical protein